MPGPDDGLGKKAEQKLRDWLDDAKNGYAFTRIPDQMSGFYAVSRNICDFICYKYPNIYYIESKSTYSDRFDFSMISETQWAGLLQKSKIKGCYGLIIILFATQQRAFILNIQDIDALYKSGKKSINIKKIHSWTIPYSEISTKASRKQLLDYTGDLQTYVSNLNIEF